MWRSAHPGAKRTREGSWLLAHSRVRDPELIPRGDLRTGPSPTSHEHPGESIEMKRKASHRAVPVDFC